MTVYTQSIGPRSEQVLVTLRQAIERGVYPRHAKLPTEAQLCKQFAASRPTIRRALSRLADEGVVVSRQGSGSYVSGDTDPTTAAMTISLMYNFTGNDLTRAQDYALKCGRLLCVFSQRREQWSHQAERRFLQLVQKQNHQGLLAYCSPVAPRNDSLLQRIAFSGIPVVHVECYRDTLPDQPYVLPDYVQAGQLGGTIMTQAGYERVIFCGMGHDTPYVRLIDRGVRQSLEAAGVEYDRGQNYFEFPVGIGSFPNAKRQVKQFIDTLTQPAGIVCSSVAIARTMVGLLREAGKKVPEQVGVIGAELIGPDRGDDVADILRFDRWGIIQRAIDAVIHRWNSPPHHLESAAHVPRGSVRGSWSL